MPNDTDDDKRIIGQMFKSMIDRNPKKRKIKPNSRNYEMLNLDLFEETSSEDEDYRLPNNAPEDDEIDESDENLNENDEESEEDEDEEDESSDEEFNYLNNMNDMNSYSISETTSTENKTSIKIKLNNSTNSKLTTFTSPETKIKKLLICSICLSDESLEIDEIAECDCCSITVHESCYGLINPGEEVESLDSQASSNTTEPWFCDACKANKLTNELNCELCPKQGGIFKQTETGRWVHLACALYINGVAFSNTQQLSGITLFEINYDRWGSKSCSLCEDERFARTGICISCDAGMCRNYFHVTCAQSHGLLCDAQNIDESDAVADPFYAHCKQHALDKYTVKIKKRNYLALQLRLKQINSMDRQMDERIKSKLDEVRKEYEEEMKISLERKNILQNLNYRAPRPLTSSSNAVRKLISKAELLGMSPQAHIISSQDMMDMRKKWHIPVAFSVEYVGYYLDREARLKSMQKKQDELNKQTNQLRNQEEQVIKSYEEKVKVHDQVNKSYNETLNSLTNLYNSLSLLSNSKLTIPPKLLATNKSSSSNSRVVNGIATAVHNLNGSGGKFLKCCGICNRSNEQHSLALCDNCNLYYHFKCLDPPLTRMPKKSKFDVWKCSECVTREEEHEEELAQMPVDVNESRKLRLRENIGLPQKFIPDIDRSFSPNSDMKRSKKRKRSSPKSTNINLNTPVKKERASL